MCALLERLFNRPATVYTSERTRTPVVTVYCETCLRITRGPCRDLLAELKRLRADGLALGSGKVIVRPVPWEDWAHSWKRHFHAMEFGPSLLIKPSWSRRVPRRGQAVVVLDPGLSFGTGQHPTTAFCLRQASALRRAGTRQSFLDIGTGSGILAITAAKLGYAPVEAFDHDPAAVKVAQANARQNGVLSKVRMTCRDLSRLSRAGRRFDVVCANLTADVLLREKERILSRLRVAGRLVVAGVLDSQFGRLCSAYAASGLTLVASETKGTWRSGTFARRRTALGKS